MKWHLCSILQTKLQTERVSLIHHFDSLSQITFKFQFWCLLKGHWIQIECEWQFVLFKQKLQSSILHGLLRWVLKRLLRPSRTLLSIVWFLMETKPVLNLLNACLHWHNTSQIYKNWIWTDTVRFYVLIIGSNFEFQISNFKFKNWNDLIFREFDIRECETNSSLCNTTSKSHYS